MSTVTNIQQVKWQRIKDEWELESIDSKISDAEKALGLLAERRRELVNRLGLNKPDHDPEAA